MSEITLALEHPSLGCGEIIARYDLSEIQEKAYQQGRADREAEIIENINSYTDMLIKAMNDKNEKPKLHEALASIRADEIRVRKVIIEQIKEQTDTDEREVQNVMLFKQQLKSQN